MLDTNIAIYVIKRRPLEVRDTFNRMADMMCISMQLAFEQGTALSGPMAS